MVWAGALFSTANLLSNGIAITTTIQHPLLVPHQPPDVASRVFREEQQIDAPDDAFCYTIVIANGKELPATIRVSITTSPQLVAVILLRVHRSLFRSDKRQPIL